MRQANNLMRDGIVELLKHAETPTERLAAIVVGNFSDSVFHREICRAWISLCSDVPCNPKSQRIQTAIHSRMHSNLMTALRPRYDFKSARSIALQISMTIDGIWLRSSLQKQAISSQNGIKYVKNALVGFMKLEGSSLNDFDTAIDKMQAVAKIVLRSNAFTGKVLGARRG